MGKSSAKSKNKNKKKNKKNSNYKNEKIEKNIPKAKEENVKKKEKTEKAKIKAEAKEKKEALKAEKVRLKAEAKEKKETLKNEKKVKEKNNKIPELEKNDVVKNSEEKKNDTDISDKLTHTLIDEQLKAEPDVSELTEEILKELNSDFTDNDIASAEDDTQSFSKEIELEENNNESESSEVNVDKDDTDEKVDEITKAEPSNTRRIEETTVMDDSEETKNEIKIKKENKLSDVFKKLSDKAKAVKLSRKQIIVAIISVITIVALIFVIKAIVVKVSSGNTPDAIAYSGRNYSESELYTIAISDEQQETLIKATAAKGDKRKFSFYAQTEFVVAEPNAKIPLTLGNPTTSETVILATLCDKNGTTLYRTLGIKPGFYLNEVSLDKYLEYGENEMELYVSAFRVIDKNGEKTYKKVGTQNVKLSVYVGDDYEAAQDK